MIRLRELQYVILLLYCSQAYISSVKIPENPCPNVFRYYKKGGSGAIYGEVVIPYDGSKSLDFTINASLAGYFENVDLKIQLATPLQHIIKRPTIKYYIFFPFSHVIPKVTQITFNGQVYCAGRSELLKSGTTGLWFNRIDKFFYSK